MSAPASSLLIPCHNAAGHLPRLWETVRAQTRPFNEIICYDDASTDDTAAVAAALGARVISGECNAGPAHARNQLWRAADTEWVHFHDADDLLEPAYHATVAARVNADTDVVICNARWLRDDTRDARQRGYSVPVHWLASRWMDDAGSVAHCRAARQASAFPQGCQCCLFATISRFGVISYIMILFGRFA